MFCVNCGNKLEEQWKVCPQCGTAVDNQQNAQKKKCEKCGNLLEVDWVKCPHCGNVDGEMVSDEKEECLDDELAGVKECRNFNFRYYKWIVLILMLIFVAIGIGIGVRNHTETNKQDDLVTNLDDVGGYEAWKESEYASKVRTNIVVTLPVVEKEDDKYAVNISSSLGEAIYIRQNDGTFAKDWKWLMDAKPDNEGGSVATFEATLTITGYALLEENGMTPIFIVEDIEKSSSVNVGYMENEDSESTTAIKEVDYASLYNKDMERLISEIPDNSGIVNLVKSLDYAYYDIDKNGYLELIVQYGICNADMKIEVYSTHDGNSTYKVGESYSWGTLYEYPEHNGFYTDYAHMDYETVTLFYMEDGKLKEEAIYDSVYTVDYGHIDGNKIEELKYPMSTYIFGNSY